jgi:hypothetical protein
VILRHLPSWFIPFDFEEYLAMANNTVCQFIVLEAGKLTLPSVGLTGPLGQQSVHIIGRFDFPFELPPHFQPEGVLSFAWETDKFNDDSVDVVFSLSVNSNDHAASWSWTTDSDALNAHISVQIPLVGLTAGHNVVSFLMDKGGTRTEPDPDEGFLGKGSVTISNVVLWYPVLAQAGWHLCNKCQGLFFAPLSVGGLSAAGVCPAGAHHASSSGAYLLPIAT